MGLPSIRLTPYAFAKIIHMMNKSENECGSMGIAGDPKDPLLITDFKLIKQEVTPVTVKFDKEAINEFQDEMDKAGVQPFQCMRVWQHCHPGNSCEPSGTDESTFNDSFSSCSWAVMLILARDYSMYARMRINVDGIIKNAEKISVLIQYEVEFPGVSKETIAQWDEEYNKLVTEDRVTSFSTVGSNRPIGLRDVPYIHELGGSLPGTSIIDDHKDLFHHMCDEDILKRCFIEDHKGEAKVHYFDINTQTEYFYDENFERFYDAETGKRFKVDEDTDWMEFISENADEIIDQFIYNETVEMRESTLEKSFS